MAIAAVSPLRLAAEAKLNIGVGTYSYHTLTMDEMIAQLVALKVKDIEMSRGEFMLMNKPEEAMFRSAHEKLSGAGIRCVSYYTATLKDDADIESAVRFGRILGVQNITGDASREMLERVDKRFAGEGLTFGLHNHFFKEKFAYESPEDVMKALDGLSPTMGATGDTGHFASCGYDTVDAIRKLAARLKLVHLKDVKAKGGEVNVTLGTGVAQIPAVVQELKRQNFSHLVAIEDEREDGVAEHMRTEVEYARSLA